MTRHVVLPNNS